MPGVRTWIEKAEHMKIEGSVESQGPRRLPGSTYSHLSSPNLPCTESRRVWARGAGIFGPGALGMGSGMTPVWLG